MIICYVLKFSNFVIKSIILVNLCFNDNLFCISHIKIFMCRDFIYISMTLTSEIGTRCFWHPYWTPSWISQFAQKGFSGTFSMLF